jgi:nicotinate-nucleotide--dimethylbenzimidazole phosphoribosyltransferase
MDSGLNDPFEIDLDGPVPPLNRAIEPALTAAIDAKAKPMGALGRIEELAIHIGLATGSLKPVLGNAAIVIFAGDHGIVAEGVTAYPSEVSAMIAQMALDGCAGANIAARAAGADVIVVDAGLKAPLKLPAWAAEVPDNFRGFEGHAMAQKFLLNMCMRQGGARNSLREPALTETKLAKTLRAGVMASAHLKRCGYGIIAFGEIGIGNTSSASLVAHAVTGLPLEKLVGAGAGAPAGGLEHKRDVLARAYARAPVRGGRDALIEFGGYEIAMMAGAMMGAARLGQIILVDGFIATAAGVAAVSIEPNLRDYLLFAHRSPEAGHTHLLEWLGARPLLDLSMRLGEGTGAALAIPPVRMAEGLLNHMADLPGSV